MRDFYVWVNKTDSKLGKVQLPNKDWQRGLAKPCFSKVNFARISFYRQVVVGGKVTIALHATQLDHWKVRMTNILVRGLDHAKPGKMGYRKIEINDFVSSQLCVTTDGLEQKVTAAVLNWWVLLIEDKFDYLPSMSSARQGVKHKVRQ